MLLQTDNSVPIGDVHLDPSKLSRLQESVVSDEVARRFQLVESLFQPMLSWNQVREFVPVISDQVRKMAEINESEGVLLLALQPRF